MKDIILQGTALHIPLADESIQCVMTSPPYYGLRDYGLGVWDGGDPACDHMPDLKPRTNSPNPSGSRIGQGGTTYTAQKLGQSAYREACPKCGAVRRETGIGLEPTPEAYVEHLLAVFREVWRVLRPDGVVWLNLGDCHNGSGGAGGDYSRGGLRDGQPLYPGRDVSGLKPKDMMGMPWRVAFALQAAGWWLRRDIIWYKPNAMPESVTDRPSSSHEYIFLLAKSERYFWDGEAVKEPTAPASATRYEYEFNVGEKERSGAGRPGGLSNTPGLKPFTGSRNLRDVWTIPTQPYRGAHFATFPERLVMPCVLSGTSARGCCPRCGAPWERVVGRADAPHDGVTKSAYGEDTNAGRIALLRQASRERGEEYSQRGETLGWRPACDCQGAPVIEDPPAAPWRTEDESAEAFAARVSLWRPALADWKQRWSLLKPVYDGMFTAPCMVMDPFSGTATVGVVALGLGRGYVGLELNAEYLHLAQERLAGVTMGMPLL